MGLVNLFRSELTYNRGVLCLKNPARLEVGQMISLSWRLAATLFVVAIFALPLVFQAPIWAHLVLDTAALALFYIVARLHAGYDPLDPRFGGCIPPIPSQEIAKFTSKLIGRSQLGENCDSWASRLTTASRLALRPQKRLY
jgi:hypothetical protein